MPSRPNVAGSGIEKGDVVLKVDGQAVDQDGNYKDADYGKISISHLFSTKHFDGETVKVGYVEWWSDSAPEGSLPRDGVHDARARIRARTPASRGRPTGVS